MLVVTWSGRGRVVESAEKIHAATTTADADLFVSVLGSSIACGEFSPVLGGGKDLSVIDRATQ